MGCGCNKNKGGSKRATANLEKQAAKKAESRIQNEPSFPSIPQLGSSDSRSVKNEEETPSPEKPSLGEKVKNFGKSMTSRMTKGRAEDSVVRLRVLSCHGDDEVVSCPYRKPSNVKEGFYYCDACGCGDKPRAFLNNPDDPKAYTKLHYPWVSCPVHMPGFSDYKPYSDEEPETINKLKEGMERKKLIEVILKEKNTTIPPAKPLEKNGDSE